MEMSAGETKGGTCGSLSLLRRDRDRVYLGTTTTTLEVVYIPAATSSPVQDSADMVRRSYADYFPKLFNLGLIFPPKKQRALILCIFFLSSSLLEHVFSAIFPFGVP
jgi:hypothetical protein